ncbi:hypothetical protein DW352_10820 [Pseudolabrys taiwanensis]|uniref:DUF6894 domain-containing protein n=1 Tax=Pseudolabrys taiwanensis TaxID=331696 RepID=A0A345ZVL4_9HYPH|nr:hypothetical protein [Pseudolabrys taiwanensis]AXK80961.1 hypothetical protein DW352_10820 [Pseudolabrys taiwanensis]
MPRYFFNLRTGRSLLRDFDGNEFDNEAAARTHAETIVRELMRNNEAASRVWRLEVCNSDRSPCFEILFATLDDTIKHLPSNLRESVTIVSTRIGSLSDAIEDVRMSIRELRATLAQTNRAPYLAAVHGRRIGGV